MEGLQLQGGAQHQSAAVAGGHTFVSAADTLLDRWTAACSSSGIWEMYNPFSGSGMGQPNLGMGTLIVDWFHRMGRLGSAESHLLVNS